MRSRTVRLGDVADFLTGFPFKSRDYSKDGSGIRLLRGDNIGQGFLRWDGVKLWPHHSAGDYDKFELKPGDVVLAMDRPWIEAGLKYSVVNDGDLPALLVQRVTRLRGTESLDTGYLRYLIGSQEFTEHVHTVSTGTAVPHISGRDILAFEFELPDMKVQKEIARTLGALDDKIELNRRISATLEEMARALYRSWFVDFDPVHARARGERPAHMDAATAALFPDSFGPDGLPKEWLKRPVASVCERVFSGGTPKTSEATYWDGDLPWLSSGETGRPIITATEKTISETGVAKSSTRWAKKGATVIASAGQGKTRGQTSMLAIGTYVNQSVIACEAEHAIVPDSFLFCDLSRRYEEFRAISDANSSRGSLTTKLVGSVECVTAGPEVMRAFDDLVVPIIEKQVASLKENRTLATLRDALLPRLMSGELRIREVEKQVEEVVRCR